MYKSFNWRNDNSLIEVTLGKYIVETDHVHFDMLTFIEILIQILSICPSDGSKMDTGTGLGIHFYFQYSGISPSQLSESVNSMTALQTQLKPDYKNLQCNPCEDIAMPLWGLLNGFLYDPSTFCNRF